MAERSVVPLGVDLGLSRVRVALGEIQRDGTLRVKAVVARDLPEGSVDPALSDAEGIAAVLEDALRELGTRQRRCVASVGAPDAHLRFIRFPKMSWAERVRAAHFEARRWSADEQAAVRVHPVDPVSRTYAVGTVNARVLQSRTNLLRASGLRAVAIDDESLALRRALPECDAIVDVGTERSAVHVFGSDGPISAAGRFGGAHVTRGIARELSLDVATAEKRKRILGCAGAGAGTQDALVAEIASTLERMRARVPIERVALTGNGARLPTLARDLERATGTTVEMPVPAILESSVYPADVLRAAMPDWALAVGLLSWSLA